MIVISHFVLSYGFLGFPGFFTPQPKHQNRISTVSKNLNFPERPKKTRETRETHKHLLSSNGTVDGMSQNIRSVVPNHMTGTLGQPTY
jgi:hypothetical protein